MVIIEYCKEGEAVSDFDLEECIKLLKLIINPVETKVIKYSTENVFYRIKLGVVRGEIDPKEIIFRYLSTFIPVNMYGACTSTPKGFLDTETTLSTEILTLAIKKQKERR